MLVSWVVVEDDVDGQAGGHGALDPAHEAQEFLVVVLGQALALDRASRHVERREERGGAMPPVVMRERPGPAFLEGQARLGAVGAWIWLFSSKEQTTARFGGAR